MTFYVFTYGPGVWKTLPVSLLIILYILKYDLSN